MGHEADVDGAINRAIYGDVRCGSGGVTLNPVARLGSLIVLISEVGEMSAGQPDLGEFPGGE